MKKTILTALLAALSTSALAANYYVVVPVPNRTPTNGNITVALSSYALPGAIVGRPYAGFDFRTALQVKGDPEFNIAGVAWALAGGALPAGLTLDSTGVINGTPSGRGTNPVQVRAEYKGKSATQGYTLPFVEGIAQFSGYRAWSDGTLALSCNEYRIGKTGYAYSGSTGDGVFRIDVDGAGGLAPADVHCDMTTDGGGWTVVQRRVNGSVDFSRTYAQYAAGFGDTTEYWLGNDRLAALTASGSRSLRVDLMRTNLQTASALYSGFRVSGADDSYRLALTWVGGTAGDSLSRHAGSRFTASDVDNDSSTGSCYAQYKGGWWYDWCHLSNLNGPYLNGPHESYADGMEWSTWTGYHESMAKTEMKVR